MRFICFTVTIFEDDENISDISIEGNTIYILFKNKIIKGQIK